MTDLGLGPLTPFHMGALFPEIPGLLEEAPEIDFEDASNLSAGSAEEAPKKEEAAKKEAASRSSLSLDFTHVEPAKPAQVNLLSMTEQEKIVKEHYPALLAILNNTKECLPEPIKSFKGDIQQELSSLSLEQMVDLGYLCLFIQIIQAKKAKSGTGQKNLESPMEVAANLIDFLMTKSWLKQNGEEERMSELYQLSDLYLQFGKCRGLSSDNLTKLEEQLDALHALGQLAGTGRYAEPVAKSASRDRRFAIQFFNALIQVGADFIPQICKVLSSDIDKAVNVIVKKNETYSNARTKAAISESGAAIPPALLEHNKTRDLALGRIQKNVARVIKSYIERLEKLKDAVPQLRASKDPLEQFTQVKELLSQGRNLRTLVKTLSTSQKDLKGIIGFLSNIYGIDDPISGLPEKTYETFVVSQAHFFEKLGEKFESLAKTHSGPDCVVSVGDIFSLLTHNLLGREGTSVSLVLMKSGVEVHQLKDVINSLSSEMVLKLDETLMFHQKELCSIEKPFPLEKEPFEKGERAELAKVFDTLSAQHHETGSVSEMLTLVSNVLRKTAGKKRAEIHDREQFNTFYRKMKTSIRANVPINSIFAEEAVEMMRNDILAKAIKAQTVLNFFSGTPFLLLEEAIFSALNWREAIDLEISTQSAFADSIFDEEKSDLKSEGKQKSKNAKRRPSPPSTKPAPAPKMSAVSASFAVGKIVTNGMSTPLGECATIMNQMLEVPEGLAPMDMVGTNLSRQRAAQLDQAFAFHFVDVMTEMLQFKNFPGDARSAVAGLLGLEMDLVEERRVTAELLKKKPNLLLKHHLKELRNALGLPVKGHPVLNLLSTETILFRYSDKADHSERGNLILQQSPELIKDLIRLVFESLPTNTVEEMVKKLEKLADTFQKRTDMGGTLTQDQLKMLGELEVQLKSSAEGMKKALYNLPKNERTEMLTHIAKHLSVLRQIPSIITHCPNQRYLMVPALMLLLSAQYAVENLGLLCAWKTGMRRVILSMGDDLHKLRAYEGFGLLDPLDQRERSLVELLDVGKAGEFIFEYCSKSSNESASELVKLISELYSWSLAAADNKGVWAPRGKDDKEFAEIQKRLIQMTDAVCRLVDKLVKSHV